MKDRKHRHSREGRCKRNKNGSKRRCDNYDRIVRKTLRAFDDGNCFRHGREEFFEECGESNYNFNRELGQLERKFERRTHHKRSSKKRNPCEEKKDDNKCNDKCNENKKHKRHDDHDDRDEDKNDRHRFEESCKDNCDDDSDIKYVNPDKVKELYEDVLNVIVPETTTVSPPPAFFICLPKSKNPIRVITGEYGLTVTAFHYGIIVDESIDPPTSDANYFIPPETFVIFVPSRCSNIVRAFTLATPHNV